MSSADGSEYAARRSRAIAAGRAAFEKFILGAKLPPGEKDLLFGPNGVSQFKISDSLMPNATVIANYEAYFSQFIEHKDQAEITRLRELFAKIRVDRSSTIDPEVATETDFMIEFLEDLLEIANVTNPAVARARSASLGSDLSREGAPASPSPPPTSEEEAEIKKIKDIILEANTELSSALETKDTLGKLKLLKVQTFSLWTRLHTVLSSYERSSEYQRNYQSLRDEYLKVRGVYLAAGCAALDAAQNAQDLPLYAKIASLFERPDRDPKPKPGTTEHVRMQLEYDIDTEINNHTREKGHIFYDDRLTYNVYQGIQRYIASGDYDVLVEFRDALWQIVKQTQDPKTILSYNVAAFAVLKQDIKDHVSAEEKDRLQKYSKPQRICDVTNLLAFYMSVYDAVKTNGALWKELAMTQQWQAMIDLIGNVLGSEIIRLEQDQELTNIRHAIKPVLYHVDTDDSDTEDTKNIPATELLANLLLEVLDHLVFKREEATASSDQTPKLPTTPPYKNDLLGAAMRRASNRRTDLRADGTSPATKAGVTVRQAPLAITTTDAQDLALYSESYGNLFPRTSPEFCQYLSRFKLLLSEYIGAAKPDELRDMLATFNSFAMNPDGIPRYKGELAKVQGLLIETIQDIERRLAVWRDNKPGGPQF